MITTIIFLLLAVLAVFVANWTRHHQANSRNANIKIPDDVPEAQHNDELFKFTLEQVRMLALQLDESLQIAINSKNPSTRVSRLEFARSRLEDLQKIAAKFPGINLPDVEKARNIIDRMASEFAEAGYYAQTDASSRSYISIHDRETLANGLSDKIEFVATMQLRTPLRILEMHGQVRSVDMGYPPGVAMQDGIWVPITKTWRELGIDVDEAPSGTMVSEIGPIPADGGDFLVFLKAVRSIVEADDTVEARRDALMPELAKPAWAEFCRRLGGEDAIRARFFPDFIDTIPSLTQEARAELRNNGWTCPSRLAAVSDKELLAVKGVGPKKLKSIRTACEEAADKDSELIDRVQMGS